MKIILIWLFIVLMALSDCSCEYELDSVSVSGKEDSTSEPLEIPSVDVTDNRNVPESEAPSETKTGAIPVTDEMFLFAGENGKSGLIDAEGNILIEAMYYQVTFSDEGLVFGIIREKDGNLIYQIYERDGNKVGFDYSHISCCIETEGGETGYTVGDMKPVAPYLASTGYGESRQYWFLDAQGTPYNELPYTDAELYKDSFVGTRDGSAFLFNRDGTLLEVMKPGVVHTFFDGKYQVYNCYKSAWISAIVNVGLLDEQGNQVFAPDYCKISMPFENIVLLFKGVNQAKDTTAAIIADPKGNIYCECYNYIEYFVLDDGWYIGIAYCNGYEIQTYDKEGEPMPAGYWFIDCYGQPIGQRYKEIRSNREYGFSIDDEYDFFIVTYEDDTTEKIPAKDVLLRRE